MQANTAQVVDDVTKQIMARLDVLAAKLGLAVQAIWNMYVAQARVELIYSLASAATVVLILIGILIGDYYYWKMALKRNSDYGEDGWAVGAGFATAVPVILAAIFLYNLGHDILIEWLNPQYWAFQQILSQIK